MREARGDDLVQVERGAMEMTGERGCTDRPGFGAFLPIWGFVVPPGRHERVERNGTARGRGVREEIDETPGERDRLRDLAPGSPPFR